MKGNKANTFLLVTSVLSMLILLIGTTFSYFTVSSQSKYDAVAVEANKISLALNISPKSAEYVGHKLIPTNNEDIMKAYNNKCVDIYGNGACLAYTLKISNFNKAQDVIGKINFTIDGIENLSYMLLDEKGDVYVEETPIIASTDMSLGEHFILDDATESNPSYREFTLIIWLTNLDKDQNEIDAGGTFTAAVSYESVFGNKLTGSINGFGEENSEVAELGGE